MCQDALNGSSRLRETHRASPLARPTTSRPKPKAWVGPVARGAPPPHMGPYGPRKMHRTTLIPLYRVKASGVTPALIAWKDTRTDTARDGGHNILKVTLKLKTQIA